MKIILTEEQFKLLLKEEFELDELQGISHKYRSWADVILDTINNTKETELVIFGDEYPELYENFPVDFFVIDLNSRKAEYDEKKSGYKNGKYVVYFYLEKLIPKSYVNHELKHSYEDYMRMSKGAPGLSQSKEGNLLFSGDFSDLMTGKIQGNFSPFKDILWDLYFTSKIEQSAYTDSVFDGHNDVIDRVKEAIEGKVFDRIRRMNPTKLGRNWDEVKSKLNIPVYNKFKNYNDFINWSEGHIKKRGEKVLKRLLNAKYFRDTNKEKGM